MAAPGAQRPAGDAGRRADGGGHHRGAGPNRWGRLFPDGARCVTCRRATSCTSGRWTVTSSKPLAGKRIHHPGIPARPVAGRAVHDIGKGRRPQRHRSRTRHADRHRLKLWPSDRSASKVVRHHLLLRTPQPARSAGPEDHRVGRRRARRRRGPAGVVARAGRGRLVGDRPRVWGDWKASLIGDLVRRCRLVMAMSRCRTRSH